MNNWSFGIDNDKLIGLVLEGKKTATSSLYNFDKIPVITGYRLHGVLLDSFPTDSRLEEAEPVIEELPGWGCDISGCRSWKDLPENARKYVCTLEKLVDHPIYLVSTGAERDAYLLRE